MMKELKGKSAIVTGSSRGIGREIALGLARSGAEVVINYAGSNDAAQQAVEEIRAFGGKAVAVRADVSEPGGISALFTTAIEQFGKVDILVNNAGIIVYK